MKAKEYLECERNNLSSYASAKPEHAFLESFELINLSNSREFSTKINKVIQLVNTHSDEWLDYEQWYSTLPQWFVSYCKPEMSQQQNDDWLISWRKLNDEDKREAEIKKGWSLADWLYWVEPRNRTWFLFDVKITDASHASVTVFTDEISPPVAALEWLLGAASVARVGRIP